MRRVQEFDDLFRECCGNGETLVFAIHFAARPSHRMMIKSMGPTGLGIIAKALKFLRENDARDVLGANANFSEGKVRFVFLGITGAGTLTQYRRRWYGHYGKLAEICWGRGATDYPKYLTLLEDKRLQFQLTFNLDNLEILDNKATDAFYDFLEREHHLRAALEQASQSNWPA